MDTPSKPNPNRGLENSALFGAYFTASQIAGYIGDRFHDPEVVDVPHGAVIALGIAVSGLTTVVYDRVRNR
jgi:hypothetical protein